MCEIFPEVDRCCLCVSLKIGMLLISVLSIMTGVAGLTSLIYVSEVSYDKVKNITEIDDPEEVISEVSNLIRAGITIMSWVFMITGMILLFATLTDSEGFVQFFVWLQFLNVIIGFVLVIAVAFECTFHSNNCLMADMDWLSSSVLMVLIVAYLFVWIYFICVANTQAVGYG